ncbi:alpha/beta hydrolase [Aquipuribacter sp. SD81]|uniref:alpha/beta hydrolase n=1 Tax=Aquipuribacter sp. SD81 TaxID=3127703 RepID=UPI00301A9807
MRHATASGRPASGAGRLPRAAPAVVLAALALAGCSLAAPPDAGGAGQPGTAGSVPPVTDPAVTAAPDDALAPFYAQRVQWGPCDDVRPPEGLELTRQECGTLEVPLDYDEPDGDTIGLALARLPASGERAGSLVLNPGGPGGSGVDYALQAELVTTDRLRAAYDVVGFDPRGVARSAPVDCVDDGTYDAFVAADPSPDDPRELDALEALAGELATGCGDDPVAPHVDSVSVARDMDVLRAALGETELDYLGKSYGTVIGALYVELFPDRVGRVVLDGAVDLTPRAPDDFTRALEQAGGFEVALEAFVADCLQQDDCPLAGTTEEGVGQVRALLASLDTAPLPAEGDDREVNQGLGLAGLISPLYNYDLWPGLRLALGLAYTGDGSVLLRLNDFFRERQPDGSYRSNAGEAIYAVNCLDRGGDPVRRGSVGPDDLDRLSRELTEAAPTFGPQLAYGALPCLDWEHTAVPWPEVDGQGAPPVVVVGTTRDPATPMVWAERLADQLDTGVLVRFDGDGHTAYGRAGSGCVDELLDAFWLEGEVPADGTTCEAAY